MNINQAIEERILKRIKPDVELVKKEFNESDYDFKKSGKAFEEGDYKWAIVQAYYSMFHSARAVLFKLGFQEKRHSAIIPVLEDLDSRGKLETTYVNDFKAGIFAREDADYHYSYFKESAKHMIEITDEFKERMKRLIEELK